MDEASDRYDPAIFITDPNGISSCGDSIEDAIGEYLDTLNFQRSVLAVYDLTPGAVRLRAAIEKMLEKAGVA